MKKFWALLCCLMLLGTFLIPPDTAAAAPNAGLLRGKKPDAGLLWLEPTDGNDYTGYLMSNGYFTQYNLSEPRHIKGYYFKAQNEGYPTMVFLDKDGKTLQTVKPKKAAVDYYPVDVPNVSSVVVRGNGFYVDEVDLSDTFVNLAPNTPTGLAALPYDGKLHVSWQRVANPSADLAGYNLYQDGVKVNATPLINTNTVLSNLTNGQNYRLEVSAVDHAGLESGRTPVLTALPWPLPTPPTIQQISNGTPDAPKSVDSDLSTAATMCCYRWITYPVDPNEPDQELNVYYSSSNPNGGTVSMSIRFQTPTSEILRTFDSTPNGTNIKKWTQKIPKGVTSVFIQGNSNDLNYVPMLNEVSVQSYHQPQLAAGEYHALYLKRNGALWSWGYNQYGQLGDGTTVNQKKPVRLTGLSNVRDVNAGYGFSMARKADGTLWAWGQNHYGQLGNGSTNNHTTPAQVQGLPSVNAFASKYDHALAVATDGTVWAWGRNSSGQLGNGNGEHQSLPLQVAGLEGVVDVKTGFGHSLALKSDGTVWAWGRNDMGQLGDDTTTLRNHPVQVTGLTDVAAIAAGSLHSAAVKRDGTVWAWGYNISGQLGDGTFDNRLTPVQVQNLTGVVEIEAGYGHSQARKTDGTVWTWGYNYSGQLGNASRSNSSRPVQVQGLTGAALTAVGGYHDLAMKSDGTLWTWGNNSYGQLGDGTVTYTATPAQAFGRVGLSLFANTSSSSAIAVIYASDTAVGKYAIKRDGQPIYEGTKTRHDDFGLAANTPYAYTLEAYDASNAFLGSKTVVTATAPVGASLDMLEEETYFVEQIYPLE